MCEKNIRPCAYLFVGYLEDDNVEMYKKKEIKKKREIMQNSRELSKGCV